MTKSLYDVLEIPRDASETDIKKAYRRLSLQYHPDRNSEPGAEAKFKEINEAHEILSDSGKRQNYDMESGGNPFFGGGGGMGGPPPGAEFHDMNDILRQVFGGAGGHPGGVSFTGMPGAPDFNVFFGGPMGGPPGFGGPMGGHPFFQQISKPPPIIKNLKLNLEQVYFGGNFNVEFEKWNVMNNIKVCEITTVNITIPPGIEESEVVILREMGNSVENRIRGDVKICIHIENNTEYQRNGLDLICKRTLTLKEALCGFKFELKHINGKTLAFNNLTNINVIKPGYKKVVPNLGMNKNGKTGNLIIEFDVSFPDVLGDDKIKQLALIL
jgi:DnaJ-class molecular chaperone